MSCQGVPPLLIPSSNTASQVFVIGIFPHISSTVWIIFLRIICWTIWSQANVNIIWIPSFVILSETTRLTVGFWNINDWIFQYENFWETIEFDSLTFRYDTLVLEEIIKKNNYPWKNLWYGFIKNSRKHYCGFEDSELENYFLHYWGKFKREIIQPSST